MEFSAEIDSFGAISAREAAHNAQWRYEDKEQRMLENARRLWERHAEENRQAVEEHAEYVRSMATLSAFMAGFVNVAFVQFGFDPAQLPLVVLMGFGITNALTMAVNTCCMAMCTLILASIFRTFTALLSEEEEAAFILRCRDFAIGYQIGNKPPAPQRNFRNHWDFFCRAEWRRALFMFSAGIGSFIVNTAFAAFIKFDSYYVAAIVLSTGLVPGLVICTYLHIRWMPHLLDSHVARPVDMDNNKELMGMPFDWHLPGVKSQKASAASQSNSICSSPFLSSKALGDVAMLPAWRVEILEQRALKNSLYLWQRFVSKTRNEVEERVEQLRSFSFLSGVLAGFAVASLLQLGFDVVLTNHGIQLWFAVSCAITAACSTCSMAMCSLMLMSIIKSGRALISEEEEAHFLANCRNFARTYKLGSRPPAPKRSFRNHWDTRCEGEWNRAFYLFSLGLAMFVINMTAGAWIKYKPYKSVSIVSNVIMGLAFAYLVQAHSRWAPYLTGSTRSQNGQGLAIAQKKLLPAGLPFDWHQPPVEPAPGKSSTMPEHLSRRVTFDRMSSALRRMGSIGHGTSLGGTGSLRRAALGFGVHEQQDGRPAELVDIRIQLASRQQE